MAILVGFSIFPRVNHKNCVYILQLLSFFLKTLQNIPLSSGDFYCKGKYEVSFIYLFFSCRFYLFQVFSIVSVNTKKFQDLPKCDYICIYHAYVDILKLIYILFFFQLMKVFFNYFCCNCSTTFLRNICKSSVCISAPYPLYLPHSLFFLLSFFSESWEIFVFVFHITDMIFVLLILLFTNSNKYYISVISFLGAQ